jgi:FkbM family methyltransferase
MYLIKMAKFACKGTSVQRLPITSYIYGRVFRYAYPEEELTVDVDGVRLTVPNRDITIVPGLVGGFYEPRQLAIFRALCDLSSTFIDVGANVGLYTCLAARSLPVDGLVIAFEPIPENVSYLKANLAQNGQEPEVRIEQAALGEADRIVTIHLDNQIGTHSISKSNTNGSDGRSLQVSMRSLDSYYLQNAISRADLIKIDAEGYDGYVLHGAKNMLTHFKPTIFVEFNPRALWNCGFNPKQLIETICTLHEEVFVIDDKYQAIHRSSQAELLALESRNIDGTWYSNLVAVTKREHIAAIEHFVANPRKGRVKRMGLSS